MIEVKEEHVKEIFKLLAQVEEDYHVYPFYGCVVDYRLRYKDLEALIIQAFGEGPYETSH